MAVKLPPNTWIGQVLTLKGFKDNVYSRIDGSLVGYVKDGKFVQTVDKLPVVKPEKLYGNSGLSTTGDKLEPGIFKPPKKIN